MAGGAAGTLARAGVAEALPVHAGAFPWATLLANLAGAALLGWLVAVAAGGLWPPLVGTGFCGALTTFSTLQIETVRLVDYGDEGLAAAYMAISVTAGLAAAELGRRLGSR
jgi:CrcB protein